MLFISNFEGKNFYGIFLGFVLINLIITINNFLVNKKFLQMLKILLIKYVR